MKWLGGELGVWETGGGCYDLMMLGRRDQFSRLYNGVVERIEKKLAAARE